MKDWIHLPIAAVVAACVGFGSQFLATSSRAARGADTGTAELDAALEDLRELRAEQSRLSERLTALPATSRTPVVDLNEAIAAYMAKQLTAEASDAPGSSDRFETDPENAAIADRILTGAVSGDELEALWQKLRAEKRIDAVLAEIEHQAELSPNNPDLQSELGKAYLQKLFDVGIGPMAGVWGEKADKAFDHALELDESHWEARFSKALALSNWPTFMGKQGESVRQFEILMKEQESRVPQPEQAMTYFFLGNLYDQKGEHEKALAAWRRGATRFPNNEGLRQKIEGR